MASAIYLLCAATSLGCAGLLVRGYRRSRARLLLWSSACFICLALANVLLFVDLVVLPHRDFSMVRNAVTLAALLLLLHGLIWDAD